LCGCEGGDEEDGGDGECGELHVRWSPRVLRHYTAAEGSFVITERDKQIPKGNDRKKGKGKNVRKQVLALRLRTGSE
jgi:hypothetical protein